MTPSARPAGRVGRRCALVLSFVLLGWACAHTRFERGGEVYVIDRAACCAVSEGVDLESERTACEARGCTWQRALLCMGVAMPDEMEAEYAAERDRCELACDCVCAEDQEACDNVP